MKLRTDFICLAVAGMACLILPITPQCEAAIPTSYPTGNGPATVSIGSDGHLIYTYESNGDTLPDFSLAGYQGGGVPIPDVPVVTTLSPVSGDNTPQIQQAINNLAAQPLGTNGFRGAIKLNAGVYQVSGTVSITASGIVLRGAGDGPNGTILRSTTGSIIFNMDGGGSRSTGSTTWEMTATYIPVGATWFALQNTTGLSVGSNVLVCRRTNSTFESAVGHPSLGDECWESVITEIDGNRIRVDTSITEAIEQQYGGGYVKLYSWAGRIENSGIEDIRADAPTISVDAQGNTGGVLATIADTKNCWFRRCTNDKMRGHTMDVERGTWVTIEDVVSFHNPLPGSHSGPSTQINTSDTSQGLLFHGIISSDGGFEFTASSTNVGPIVFTESSVPHGFAFSGPHQKWNIGTLYDCLDMHHGLVVANNGTGGWTAGNHLAWNCETTSNYTFQRAPTVHQWIQGCIGPNPPVPPTMGGAPEVVSYGTHLQPGSLYRAQLAERVGAQAVLNTLGGPDGSNRYILSSNTSSRTISAGASTTYPVTMTVAPLYKGETVSFSATGLPSGASASFSPGSLTANGTTTATIQTSASTPAGTYNVKLVGTGTFNATSGQTMTLAQPLYVQLVVTASTGALLYEAESLTVDSSSQSVTTIADSNCSGGSFRQLNAVAVGDFVKFLVPSVPAGTYDLRIGIKKNNNRAIVQTKNGKVGGTYSNFGPTFDEYSSAAAYTEVDLGAWTVSSSDKFVGFHVTGKNASSSGFVIGIDFIKLVPQ